MRLNFENVAPSPTAVLHARVRALKASGVDVLNLGIGEPVLDPHPLIADAAIRAIRDGKTCYPPVTGIQELRERTVQWLNRMNHSSYSPDQILVTCGGKFGIFATCQAVLSPHDEVVIVSPYWVSYPGIVSLFGARPHVVETHEADGWQISVDAIRAAMSEKTKMVLLNNGCNPTGAVYSPDALRAVCALAQERDILLLSDEVYSGLTYDDAFVSCGSFQEYREHVVVIQSCSKNFAMTGWRVGFIAGPKHVIDVVTMLGSQSTMNTSSVSQWAALAAVEHAETIMTWVRDEMHARRDLLVDRLRACGVSVPTVPAAGLYLFLSLEGFGSQDAPSLAFCERLLGDARVAAVPGSAFGKEGYVRFSFGPEQHTLDAASSQLAEFL